MLIALSLALAVEPGSPPLLEVPPSWDVPLHSLPPPLPPDGGRKRQVRKVVVLGLVAGGGAILVAPALTLGLQAVLLNR